MNKRKMNIVAITLIIIFTLLFVFVGCFWFIFSDHGNLKYNSMKLLAASRLLINKTSEECEKILGEPDDEWSDGTKIYEAGYYTDFIFGDVTYCELYLYFDENNVCSDTEFGSKKGG